VRPDATLGEIVKIAAFDNDRVGVVRGDDVLDVSSVVPASRHWPPTHVSTLIAEWDERQAAVRAACETAAPVPLSQVSLLPPVQAPLHVVGAPANYRKHIAEMGSIGSGGRSMRELGFFLMAPSSLVGPGGRVLLPRGSDRRFHHECELAVVIGRRCRDVSVDAALGHVFGYAALMDLTMRMTEDLKEERTMRKSFDTFTPMGPWITTADEVPDPQDLRMELFVNDELRQQARTADMIVPIAEQISMISSVMTLQPGDVLATGTPDGVGDIRPGDVVRISIEHVGGFSVEVHEASDHAPVRF
jgi:2-keto-4-pentenoate hydratase/2-oxohepta-3-ene-1,7-dioic acid hydratase in catechol pathway